MRVLDVGLDRRVLNKMLEIKPVSKKLILFACAVHVDFILRSIYLDVQKCVNEMTHKIMNLTTLILFH